MIAAQRRGLILDQVRRRGGVSIGVLADAVGVRLVLVDASKFLPVASCEGCPLTRVQTIITDSALGAAHRDALAELEIETILAEPTEA